MIVETECKDLQKKNICETFSQEHVKTYVTTE